LTVAFSSADASKCTVDANGIVVLKAAGTCTIHAEQAGTLNVVAAASRVSRSFEIFPAGSSAPFVTSVSRGLGSLTATLVPPFNTGGATITRYEVQAFDASGNLAGFNNNCAVVTPQKCTVDGLVEGVNYTLRARAHHTGGTGSLSPASAAYAPIGNPDAVRELTALADNTSLTISWLAPLELGGASFTRYEIFIKLASDNSYPGTASHVVSNISSASYTFTGLVNGESYEVKMVTITSEDSTEAVSNSAVVSQVPFTTPNAVRDLTAIQVGQDIFISWRYPDFDGGRQILEFDVDGNSGSVQCIDVTTLYCTVAKGTDELFDFSTTADNVAGTSPAAIFTLDLRTPATSGDRAGGGVVQTQTPPIVPTLFSPELDQDQGPVLGAGRAGFIQLDGRNLNLITDVFLGTRKLQFELVTNERIRILIPASAVGKIKLELRHSGGSLEQELLVQRDDLRVNAGSFKGVVAIYAKGFEGQRLSAKVGEDWVIVRSLGSNYVRLIEPIRALGKRLLVRIFIDRRLVGTVSVVTE